MKKLLSLSYDLISIFLAYLLLMLALAKFAEYPFSLISPIEALKTFPWVVEIKYSLLTPLGLLIILLTLNPFRVKENLYGGAHWASETEIKKMGLRDKKGLILGKLRKKYLRTNDSLSVLLYAPPGSGKTAGIIIPSLLSCGNSAIVHDPKGELLEKTGQQRSKFSKIIKFSVGEEVSAKWNPLSKKELPEKWDDIQVQVDRIASSLFPTGNNKEESMWTIEAKSVFNFWALLLIYQNEETTFSEILKISLSSGDPQDTISEYMEKLINPPERIITEGNGLLAKADREFAGVLGTFKSKMAVFIDPRVANNLSGNDFSLWDLKKETTTIYLTVKNTDQTRLKPILSLFFEIATLTNIDHEPTKQEKKVTFFLDEFVRLSKMQELLQMPAIGRSYNLNAIYVCQSFSQIADIYGDKGADQLKNTCSYHLFFAQNEQKIAEDISKSIGKKTRKKKSVSLNTKQVFKSTSESDEGVPLILPQEVMSLKQGKHLICKQGHFETPINAETPFWFKDAIMKKIVLKNKTQYEIINGLNNKDSLKTNNINEPEIKDIIQEDLQKEEILEQEEDDYEEEIEEEDDYETVAKCTECKRSTVWDDEINQDCMKIKEDGTICKGLYKPV